MSEPGRGTRGALARQAHYWVLAASLLLTLLGAGAIQRMVEERDVSTYRNAVQATQDRIRKRFDTHLALLLATRSFFEARPIGELGEFRRYVAGLELARRYPGIQGIGLSLRLSREQKPAVEQELRRQGHASFRVWPPDDRPEYHSIVFLEPLDRRNEAAIGYDMLSEPIRRVAMARAWDSGAPAASRKVTLVQEIDADKQAGFLIYVPVYREPGLATADARRASLIGFVYSPFRVDDLLAGIFVATETPRVSYRVFDGAERRPEARMYPSRVSGEKGDAPRFSTVERLDVAGTTWTLEYRSTPALEAASSRRFVPAFAVVGLLASLLLFHVTRAQVHARAEAERSEAEARNARADAEAQRNNQVLARHKVEALAVDLQKAVRVRDEFVSVAGHELKTPLATLKLQVQNLQHQVEKGTFGTPNERFIERLVKANRHIDRLERLIEQLLDVSRITSGGMQLHVEPVDLTLLLEEVIERFEEQLSRVRCEVCVRSPAPVLGNWDRLRIDQVLTNLISNAAKYGAGKPIEVTVAEEADVARVSVRDQGIGIAAPDRERIFARFERAVSDRRYGGLGLGLWISSQIAHAHGGRILLESREGGGSTFTVELPRRGVEVGAAIS